MSASPAPSGPQARAPLAGVRVLDLTQFMSGPFGTQILGDLGADVVKVEAPEGDLSRRLPPHFVGDDSVYYLCLNRNKRSLALDLKTSEGREHLGRLAARADVIVENFRPGVVTRLGLDAEALLAANPELVWCSISGFGQTGPARDLPAYDMIVQALSGGMSLTGERGGRAVRAGVPVADLCAGLYAVIAILASLRRRERGDGGDAIDISMLDCQVAMLTYQAGYVLQGGETPGPQGRGHESIPTYDAFTGSDGVDLVVAASTERMWRDLAAALGLNALIADRRFVTNANRHANRDALRPLLQAAFARRPAEAWVQALVERGVPVGAVNTVDRALADPQVRQRGMVAELRAADGRIVQVPASPLRFASGGAPAVAFPPALNEHAAELASVWEEPRRV